MKKNKNFLILGTSWGELLFSFTSKKKKKGIKEMEKLMERVGILDYIVFAHKIDNKKPIEEIHHVQNGHIHMRKIKPNETIKTILEIPRAENGMSRIIGIN